MGWGGYFHVFITHNARGLYFIPFGGHTGHQFMGAPRQCIWEEADLPRAQEAVHSSKAVVVVLGAGASTSSGIPDFRSANGIYSMAGSVQGPPGMHNPSTQGGRG
mmetsp:Transcript_21242/g.67238  ORF Transcript_21242/g.67238 Transcript_21242/m.67238 type:complete len:105 (-) Transcript_21242:170-484(-)